MNLSECEFCVYHAKAALRQVSNKRPDVQGRTLFERQLKPVVDRGGIAGGCRVGPLLAAALRVCQPLACCSLGTSSAADALGHT